MVSPSFTLSRAIVHYPLWPGDRPCCPGIRAWRSRFRPPCRRQQPGRRVFTGGVCVCGGFSDSRRSPAGAQFISQPAAVRCGAGRQCVLYARYGSADNCDSRDGRSLVLRNGSRISSRADIDECLGGSNGGNIFVDADVIAAVDSENSDIDASAVDGRGGRVELTTQGIFGITFRSAPTNLSDITVNSRFGPDGTVTINGLTVDPSQGLTDLPTQPVDASRLIARGCGTAGTATALAQQEFVSQGVAGCHLRRVTCKAGRRSPPSGRIRDQGSEVRGQGLAPSPHPPTRPLPQPPRSKPRARYATSRDRCSW